MLPKAQEIKYILNHLNSIVKCNHWDVKYLCTRLNEFTQLREKLYEVSFNNNPLVRCFWSDLFRTPDKVFLEETEIYDRLLVYNFIKIKCELKKK